MSHIEFVATTTSKHSVRVGRLQTSSGASLATPALLYYNRLGAVPHLINTHLPALQIAGSAASAVGASESGQPTQPDSIGMTVAMEDFLPMFSPGFPRPPVISFDPARVSRFSNRFDSLASYMALDEKNSINPILIADLADIGACSERVGSIRNKFIFGRIGGVNYKVSPKDYIQAATVLKPDILVSLFDFEAEQPGTRTKSKVDRNLGYLDMVIKEKAKSLAAASLCIFGVVDGGSDMDERARAASKTIQLFDNDLSGYVLPFLARTDLPTFQQSLRQTIGHLTETKPRICYGVSSLEQLLVGIREGVDLFDSNWVCKLAEDGIALRLSENTPETMDMKSDPQKWVHDQTVMVSNCGCPVCTRPYHRAYINHLFKVKDMLPHALLNSHNLWQFNHFFSKVRAAIQDGTLGEYLSQFEHKS
ncbi:tRNA-guanine(15) transglycosylase-like protein [Polychytrium aggregatum]|uniref:tRNA-guanine(15) transglycosylase-like protein n=1 Tax=Polychytrium aggregatum TaxID=110093 RepID=UPI0022FE2193|nr:tRNA-guanine(15) transglycosylase-like protein [Polychytrium aggregatum]KAI9203360.1 tRNA-guanine(15) transglycosylase-like protein [Polychytrium aggregatum]